MKAIIAIDANYGIGVNNGLPWPHNRLDMKVFREYTRGAKVVMGRNTWESLPSKLPGRVNIVVSRSEFDGPDLIISDLAIVPRDCIVMGGKQLYMSLLPLIDEFMVTKFTKSYEVDTTMPESFLDGFREELVLEDPDGLLRVYKYTRNDK